MTTRKKKTSKAKKKDLPLRVFAIKPPTKRKKSGKRKIGEIVKAQNVSEKPERDTTPDHAFQLIVTRDKRFFNETFGL